MSPDSSNQDTWEIVLTANKAVSANDEVLLSYGERNNDEFFGAYGFVPPRNPHEEMILFGDVVEALEWHHHFYPPPVSKLCPSQPAHAISLSIPMTPTGSFCGPTDIMHALKWYCHQSLLCTINMMDVYDLVLNLFYVE